MTKISIIIQFIMSHKISVFLDRMIEISKITNDYEIIFALVYRHRKIILKAIEK